MRLSRVVAGAIHDATYDRSAAAFANADHVSIVIHNYRWRLSLADGEPQYDQLETRLAQAPVITVPSITIASDFDGAAADGSSYRAKFSGKYAHRVLPASGTTCRKRPLEISLTPSLRPTGFKRFEPMRPSAGVATNQPAVLEFAQPPLHRPPAPPRVKDR
jgi:hypothetical protein